MKKMLLPVTLLAVMLTIPMPALAQEMPDIGSATRLPYPLSDYEITNNGSLILEGDIVLSCEGLSCPGHYDLSVYESYEPEVRAKIRRDYKKEYEALAEACTEAGFPPKDTLPETGGPPLAPIVLLLGGGWLARAIALRLVP